MKPEELDQKHQRERIIKMNMKVLGKNIEKTLESKPIGYVAPHGNITAEEVNLLEEYFKERRSDRYAFGPPNARGFS